MTAAIPPLAPEEELVLRLVGTRERRERDREVIEGLVTSSDPRRLRRLIAFYRMDALLGKRLTELTSTLPDSVTAELEESYQQERHRGLAQELITIRLADLLEKQGIACVPLKGQSLSRAVHGDVGLRSSSDVDLLVHSDQLDGACGVLRSHGYGAPLDSAFEHDLPLLHYRLPSVRGTLPPVELHWRVHWFETTFSQRLLDRSTTGSSFARRPAPDDELAALLLFYARDGFTGLRLLADIAAWWDAHGNDLPDRGLEPIARLHPELTPSLRAAAAVSERLAGVPAASLCRDPRLRSRRERLATRMADLASSSDPDQVAADKSLIDALLSPAGGARAFVRRQLAVRPPGGRMLHLSKLVPRFVVALWRLRGGRSWTAVQRHGR